MLAAPLRFLSSLTRHRRARKPAPLLRAAATALLFILLLPLLMVLDTALFGTATAPFLSTARLANTLHQTFVYVAGTVIIAALIGAPAAWLTTIIDFPFRRIAMWLLFLPFAFPPYLMAYVYADFASEVGARPPPMLMAMCTSALATYPYIFFMARYALRQQHCHIQSAARLLGCSAGSALWRVSLPLARPALVVGITLVALETLNDVAVAEFFGINAIGISIYDLWLNREDFVNAARLATVLMLIVLALVVVEEQNRERQQHYTPACDRCFECERAPMLTPQQTCGVWAVLSLPIIMGFIIPTGYLFYLSVDNNAGSWLPLAKKGFVGSLFLAAVLVMILLIIGVVYAMDKRFNRQQHPLARAVRTIYALPGTILAQGAFAVAVAAATISNEQFSLWTFCGGFFLLFLALSARFFIIVGGALEVGMNNISHKLDDAAKLAALPAWRVFIQIHLPLLRPAIVMVTILLFLETLKELPMTLILRPFNFDTLSTIIYQYASDENLSRAAPAALLLVALAAAAISLLFLLEGKDTRGNG